jgi:hypothetical protein
MTCPKCHRTMIPGIPGEQKCITCGMRVYAAWPEDVTTSGSARELNGMDQYCDCEVCGNRMRVSTDRPWCSCCETKMRSWRRSGQTRPVPIIQVGGKWQMNPEWKGKRNPRGPSHNNVRAAA